MKKPVFERVPEKELMDDVAQATAYANANFEEPHEFFVELLNSYVRNLKHSKLLDIGAGDGDIAIRVAKKFNACSIYGFDGSLPMINLARKKIQENNLSERIHLQHSLIKDGPYKEMGFDGIICNSVLHHINDTKAYWNYIINRAKEKSWFFIMDLARPESISQVESLVTLYAKNESRQLKLDFYNSLLAAYTIEEVKLQLSQSYDGDYEILMVSDRHFIVFSDMFA